MYPKKRQIFAALVSLLVLPLAAGCGGDYADDYLQDGDSITVGKTVSVSAPISFSLVSCTPTSPDECTAEMEAAVLLPPQVDYAGGAEVVTGTADLLFGEGEVQRLETQHCARGGTMLRFLIPQRTVDYGDDEDESIAIEIIDDIVDGAFEEFRFKILAREPGNNLGMWFNDQAHTKTADELCRMYEGAPFTSFNIVP